MTSPAPLSASSLAAYTLSSHDEGTYMPTAVIQPLQSTYQAAATAMEVAPPPGLSTGDCANQIDSLRYLLPASAPDSGVASDAPPALVSAPLIGGNRHDRTWQSSLSLAPLHAASPPSVWEGEEIGAVALEEIGRDISDGAGAEEDEAAKRDEAQTERCGANLDDQRLYMHPIAAAAAARASFAFAPPADPITAALARQQQQQQRGESCSPLSPRTLQALCAASAAGRYPSFLAQLTADDVLAPPPLALTWYPSVPPGVTRFADRKRTAEGLMVTAMHQHEKSRIAEEYSATEISTGAVPPLRRLRTEEFEIPRVELQPPLSSSSVPASVRTRIPPPGVHLEGNLAKMEDSAAAAGTSAAAGVHANAHRKRDRDERVYEYLSHGRRLR
ncbi:hypothetical protein LSCM1_04643 [Leishmania martiniquensis]|uniref:Uncharacterized protein n=1 Tax=Leishmania martiniquensis TaxID=1580590 RepID=A0A836HML5_9TRYP|nr:hypothetical protein LSCM1_04643 [Leishmania martiniquensis]